MTEYTVSLDAYSGPLDLLLFLIRRDEIDIYDIPLARLTAQYLEYVELLEVIDPDHLSEFLVLAATLIELKSRTLLPRPVVEEGESESVDPRLELVQQLLEYKKFKDAARSLDDAAHDHARKHARAPVLPEAAPDEVELDSLDLWDLVDAFKRMLDQVGRAGAVHRVGIDDTPLALHAEDIVDSIQHSAGRQPFENIFAGRDKAEMIGLFLALLELIRQKRVRVSQDTPFGPILVHLLDATPIDESAEGDEDWAYKAEEIRAQSFSDASTSAGVELDTEATPGSMGVELDTEATAGSTGVEIDSAAGDEIDPEPAAGNENVEIAAPEIGETEVSQQGDTDPVNDTSGNGVRVEDEASKPLETVLALAGPDPASEPVVGQAAHDDGADELLETVEAPSGSKDSDEVPED